MARGVVEAFNSDLGLSVTGVAGPLGGSAEKPVGTVCFGLALKLDGTRADWLAPIENSLTLQGWSLSTRSSATDLAVFICEKRFGDYLSRELVQKRASVFALCTLVAVSESVRGLIK